MNNKSNVSSNVRSLRQILPSALALSIAVASLPADAQQASQPPTPSALEEVVVTARRKEESLQAVPVAISVLSARELEARGVARTADITTSVPGVFAAPGSIRGSNTPVFAIRGQVNRDPNLTNDPSVGVYFAEVPWARPEGTNAAVLDLQSIQVLKGPQGTLFGRNSTAGAILITPNEPTSNFEGYGKVSAGNYRMWNVEGVVNLPLGDKAALRIAGNQEQRDGYLEALPSGQKLNNINDHSLRGSLKFTPTDSFTTTFIASWYKTDASPDGERLYRIAPAPPSAAVASLYPSFVAALAATNALGKYQQLTSFAPSVAAVKLLGVPQVFLSRQFAHVETSTFQDTSKWDLGSSDFFGNMTVKNIVSYRQESDDNTFETAAVPFLAVQDLTEQAVKQVTEEFQVQGKRGDLDYVVGAFFFRESGNDTSLSYTGVPISTYTTDNYVVNTSYSVFAHMNYDMSAIGVDGLSVTGGVRLNNDKRYIDYRNRRGTTPGHIPPLFTCLVNSTVPPNDGSLCHYHTEASFHEPTWDVGLNYKVAPDSLLYGSVSGGYRSGGFSEAAQNIPATTPFLPEKVYTYEIGSKNDFSLGGDAAARVNVAAYYTDYRDIQRTINFVGPSGISTQTVNAAGAHIWGGEADLTIRPASNLEATFSYSYIKPTYTRFSDTYVETNRAFFPAGTPATTTRFFYPVDVSDSQFINVSRHSLNANLRYTFPVADYIGKPSAMATYYYRTGFYTLADINTAHCTVPGDPNPAAFYINCYNHGGRLPGYGLLNLRFDWANVLNRGVDLGVFVNNATNKYYFPNAINTLGALGTLSVQIGPPRMFGVELRVSFGGAR